MTSMCPHCGLIYPTPTDGTHLVPLHYLSFGPKVKPMAVCPGSEQTPRNPESDRRPLWKDLAGMEEED